MIIKESTKTRFKAIAILTAFGSILGVESVYLSSLSHVHPLIIIGVFLISIYFGIEAATKAHYRIAWIINQPEIGFRYFCFGLIIGIALVAFNNVEELGLSFEELVVASVTLSMLTVIPSVIFVNILGTGKKPGIQDSMDRLETALSMWNTGCKYFEQLEKIVLGYKPVSVEELDKIEENAEKEYHVLVHLYEFIEECEKLLGNRRITSQLKEIRRKSQSYFLNVKEVVSLLKTGRRTHYHDIQETMDQLAYLNKVIVVYLNTVIIKEIECYKKLKHLKH